jgi:hypothetical protein
MIARHALELRRLLHRGRRQLDLTDVNQPFDGESAPILAAADMLALDSGRVDTERARLRQ